MQRVVSPKPRAQALDVALGPIAGPDDLCLVIGGDGTMLEAIHRFDRQYRYLGLNCGHLGFLMNEVQGDIAARVAGGAWFTHTFPRLRMRAHGVERLAVNDVYVERSSGVTCHLKVTVDGEIGRAHV
jgi:NAD+ kinase